MNRPNLISLEAAAELGRRLAAGDRSAAPAALNLLEQRGAEAQDRADALLAELSPAKLGNESPGVIVGITGPPGAGKSTLLSELISLWRSRDRSVAVLAIDPSSKRSGGSLLGDRARMAVDSRDDAVLVRSSATATRLGGLAPTTRESAIALAAAFDVVIVETVGVGQSETDIAELADVVVVIVQPASGDVLQFIKSGVMEIPDILVVTKKDLGKIALSASRDLHSALRAVGSKTPVLLVSSVAPASGVDDLIGTVEEQFAELDLTERRARVRRLAALDSFTQENGERGLRALGGRRGAVKLLAGQDPALGHRQLRQLLDRHASAQ
ncbi:MAG: ArgK/MeaB family GTPase [Solirubrobacterales bacterium]